MKNGQVKHSKDLVDADLAGQRKQAEVLAKYGMCINVRTLAEVQSDPGYYINFAPSAKSGGSLKGPFDSPEQASEAHREWMWESKHS
jgi:hypothetical protein